MDGATRRNGPGGAQGGGVASNTKDDAEKEEEEILYVPPGHNGLHLTATWPIKCPVACMTGNCKTKIKSDNRYSVVNDFTRHMKSIHNVGVTGKTNMCGVCHIAIGRCPANHACFKDRKMLLQTDDDCPFICDICNQTFPSYRGPSNHNVTHKKNDLQYNYNRKNNLPNANGASSSVGTGARKKVVAPKNKADTSRSSGNISSILLLNTSRSMNSGKIFLPTTGATKVS